MRRAFTTVELAISVALIAMIAVMAVPFTGYFLQKRTVETYQQDIIQALRTAQGRSMSLERGQPWSVMYEPDGYTLCADTSCDSATFKERKHMIDAHYVLSWNFTNSTNTIGFSALKGVASTTGTITVTNIQTGISKVVTVNGAGLAFASGSSSSAAAISSSAMSSSAASSSAAGSFNPDDPIPSFPQAPIATVNLSPCSWSTWEQLKLDAMVVRSGIAYVTCSTTLLPFSHPGRLFIVDTTQNPPVILKTLQLPYVPTDMKLDGDRAYILGGLTGPNVFTTGLIDIINIQNPATAASLSTLTYANPGFPHNMIVEGSSIYVADGSNGEKLYLFTLNASKTALATTGTFTLNASSNRFAQYLNIAMTSTHLYVARAFNSPAMMIYRRDGPLQFTTVYDSQAPGAQPLIGAWNAQDILVNNGIIYAPSPSGLNTVSGNIPILTQRMTGYPSTVFPTVFAHGRYMYLTSVSPSAPIRIFDLQNPAVPQLLLQTIPMAQRIGRLPYAEGKYLYIMQNQSLNGSVAVAIYDLSKP